MAADFRGQFRDNSFVRDSYREYRPCAALQPFVQCYWSREATAAGAGPALNRVLPDGCMDIVFNFGDAWSGAGERDGHRGGAVVGTMTAPLLVRPGRREEFVGVRFRPGRAPALLGIPAREFTDDSIALAAVWGREGAMLEERLAELPSAAARKAALERELLQRLARASDPDPYVDAVVGLMTRHYGVISIARACEFAGITRQHLARRFEQHVGVRPKMFNRVVRFQSLLTRMGASSTGETAAFSWSGAALDAGYYDQAHMIADFRQFAGLTAEAFRNQRSV